MKTNKDLLQERIDRLNKAIRLEKTDHTPVVLQSTAFSACHMGVKLSDFCRSLKFSNQVMLNSIKDLEGVDGFNSPFNTAQFSPMTFMTKIRLPGHELPEDTLWQIDEREIMSVEDYDTIINMGWNRFMADYIKNRLNFDTEMALEQLAYAPQAVKNFHDAGYYVYAQTVGITVNEYFSAGRSMAKFMHDLYRIPDKVEAALDVVLEETLEMMQRQIRRIQPKVVFISPTRGASEFFSRKLWERFVWKYLKAVADMIIGEGAICNLHLDSNWERDLEYFKSFPKGSCVFETDGVTNIHKIKKILGDRMCIKGDVHSSKLVLGNPDEVYDYCVKLIKDISPGLILSSGCSVPPNAKLENVRAMVAAAAGT
jgi:hypothetical protein